jgi:hypothetical protein
MEGLLCNGPSVSIHSAGSSLCFLLFMSLPFSALFVKFYAFPAKMQMNRNFLIPWWKLKFYTSVLNNTGFPFWIYKKILCEEHGHVHKWTWKTCKDVINCLTKLQFDSQYDPRVLHGHPTFAGRRKQWACIANWKTIRIVRLARRQTCLCSAFRWVSKSLAIPSSLSSKSRIRAKL